MVDSKEQPSAPRVSALHELREGFGPSRDLWPDIENRLVLGRGRCELTAPISAARRHWLPAWAKVAAAAVVLVAVGVWIGHVERTLYLVRQESQSAASAPMLTSSCVSDAQYLSVSTALQGSPSASLAGLPPDSRRRVLASLATVHNAVQDIEAELARDSTSPLLQELLLTTCQDETRVLTEVQSAGSAEHAVRGI